MSQFNVNLEPILDDIEVHEKDKTNVALIEVLSNNRVLISMSRNAMIGFAQELLRMAHTFTNGYHNHIDPVETLNHTPQVMGFYSHPDSAELIVCCSEFQSIDTYIQQKQD